jgi:NCS2 family nucleobase:cation symporter-2
MRPANLIYSVDDRPPSLRLFLLGLQYAVQICVYLIIVVIVLRHAHVSRETGTNVLCVASIAIGIGTALQALPKGPIGSGYLAPPVFSAIYLAPSVLAAEIGGLPLVFGMTVFAGTFELVLSCLVRRLRVIFQPVLAGLTVFVVGLQLGVVGIGETLDVSHEGLPGYPLHLLVTTLTLGSCVALTIWGKGALRLFSALLALITGSVASLMVGLIGKDALIIVASLPVIAIPRPNFVMYEFDIGLIPAFLAAGLAATLRTVGVVTTCQRINDSAWKRPDMANIEKGIRADALGTILGGVLGAPGMNIAPSLVGISAATGATSRSVAFVAAAVLLVFGFAPSIVGGFLELPSQVAGAMLVFTSSFMIAGGMQIMLSRTLDSRTIYVISISTLLALSKNIFPKYFTDLPSVGRSFASSDLAIGLTAGIVLTLLFRIGTRETAHLQWPQPQPKASDGADWVRSCALQWGIKPEVAQQAATSALAILKHIEADLPLTRVALKANYDGLDLILDMRCSSDISTIQIASRSPIVAGGEADNEEAPAWIGLRNYLANVYADRKKSTKPVSSSASS